MLLLNSRSTSFVPRDHWNLPSMCRTGVYLFWETSTPSCSSWRLERGGGRTTVGKLSGFKFTGLVHSIATSPLVTRVCLFSFGLAFWVGFHFAPFVNPWQTARIALSVKGRCGYTVVATNEYNSSVLACCLLLNRAGWRFSMYHDHSFFICLVCYAVGYWIHFGFT